MHLLIHKFCGYRGFDYALVVSLRLADDTRMRGVWLLCYFATLMLSCSKNPDSVERYEVVSHSDATGEWLIGNKLVPNHQPGRRR